MNALSLLLGGVLAASLCSPALAQDAPAERDARLVEADGEVTVYTAESPDGVPAEDGMPLSAGDRVATGADGGAEIGFEDGHLLTLKPNSDLTLAKNARKETELKLTLGSLLAKIQSLLAGESLKVRTPTAVAAVRGTEFGVEVEGPETAVGVFEEGRVEVTGDAGGAETLGPNQETSVRRGQGPLKPGELRRLMRHRRLLKAMAKRSLRMKKRWKALPPEKRRELRRKLLERMRERREDRRQRLERRQKRLERRAQRRPGRAPRRPRAGQP